MKARKTAIVFFVAALLPALPQAALGAEAESVVPPENSAATQYTEALPTAGGDKQAGGGGKKPTPAKVLGAKNAKELESHGQAGREVARVAAETAPPSAAPAEAAPASTPGDGGDDNRSSGTGSATPGDGDSGGAAGQPKRPEAPPSQAAKESTELPSGSSGLGEILAEATGSSSSGGLGALLPLAILAAIAWSLAFLWRQRRPAE